MGGCSSLGGLRREIFTAYQQGFAPVDDATVGLKCDARDGNGDVGRGFDAGIVGDFQFEFVAVFEVDHFVDKFAGNFAVGVCQEDGSVEAAAAADWDAIGAVAGIVEQGNVNTVQARAADFGAGQLLGGYQQSLAEGGAIANDGVVKFGIGDGDAGGGAAVIVEYGAYGHGSGLRWGQGDVQGVGRNAPRGGAATDVNGADARVAADDAQPDFFTGAN